ncbi:polysaccharide deacetylase family protein [Streptomyces sp. 8K308]|uniref:polysaccharide deacetylase family protein n=1 Tax=Streptomyces sp. 8K308 TaxID=2530388 RepID=UPI001FB59C0E|nr:polysaccharide deacetylase family protein [Streptomyces sp. 8K308]
MEIIGQVRQIIPRGGQGPPVRLRWRARRCGLLGGATILALACSGAVPTPPTESDDRRLLTTVAGAPAPPPHGPGSGGDPALALGAPQRAAQARTVADALAAYAKHLERAETRRIAAAKSWGLRRVPLRAPAPPAEKPELTSEPGHIAGKGLPPVIVRVPTDEKVVFLTIDDGAEKDPKLLEMMRELDIPYSSFLSDYVARDDYDYFRQAHRDGSGIQNHSVNHREMPKLSYEEQRTEICRQQDTLEEEIGERPTLFRPPYGAYDRDTLRAAASCGVEVVPLWAEEAFPDRIAWGRGDEKLQPGDIILTHFRGTSEWGGSMPDMVRRVLDTATAQGFALARLEDYL